MKTTIQSAAAGLLALTMCVSWQVSEVLAADSLRTLHPAQRVTRPLQTAPVSQPTPTLVSVSKAEPNEASVSPGGFATVALSGTGLDGIFSAKVRPAILASGAVTATLDDGSSSSRRLTISADDAAVPGTYTVQLAVEGGGLVAVLTVVVSAPQAVKSAPTGMRIVGSPATPQPSRSVSPGAKPAPSPVLSRRLTPGSSSSDRLEDQTTAGFRSGAVAERMSRLQPEQGVARTLPGSQETGLLDPAQDRGSLSSRLGDNRLALSQNPALEGGATGPLGEGMDMDRGTRRLVGEAEQFRSGAQSPGGASALNPSKGTLPTQDGFTADSRLAAGDEGNDPAPGGTNKPAPGGTNKPTPGKVGPDTVIQILLPEDATEEEKEAVQDLVAERFPGAKVIVFPGSSGNKRPMKTFLGWLWSKVPTNRTRYEPEGPNDANGVRGMCPPDSMTCGLTGKTWAQLSPGERKRFCDEFESELDKYRSGGSTGATACDADSLKEPAWSEIMTSNLGPLILTDEEGDSGIIVPATQRPYTKGDLAGSLPDPGEPGAAVQPVVPGKNPSGGPGTGGH